MNGAALYTFVTSLLNGYQMDTATFYIYLNLARTQRESMRPFKYLEKTDTSQIAQPVGVQPIIPFLNPLTLPSDFLYLKEDGFITLYDNNLTWQTYLEIPQNLAVQYLQQNNKFYVNHAAGKYYLTGIVDRQYIVYFPYQADLGDITANTTWLNIPPRYHSILGFDVASMYRLGQDYDDIQARNAESNTQQANMLFDAMCKWDDNLARSSVTTMDRPTIGETPTFTNRKINVES